MKKIIVIALFAFFGSFAFAQVSTETITPTKFDPATDMEKVTLEITTASTSTITGVYVIVVEDLETFESDQVSQSQNLISFETVNTMAETIQPMEVIDTEGVTHTFPITTPTFYENIDGYIPPALELDQSMDEYFQTLAEHGEAHGLHYIAWFSGGTETGQSYGLIERSSSTDLSDFGSSGKRQVSMFPNPTNGLATFTGLPEGNHLVQIHDFSGKLISQETVVNNEQVDLSNLAMGSYIATVIINNSMETTRFVLQK